MRGFLSILIMLTLASPAAFGAEGAPPAPPAAPIGTDSVLSKKSITSDKAIEVKGQSRGAALMNLSKEKFKIKFVKIRTQYTDEILNTPY